MARSVTQPGTASPDNISPRQRIASAAFDILADKGFDAASVAAIARAAGMSAGSVYQHFSDKREILDAAFDEAVAKAFTTIDPGSTLAYQPTSRADTVALLGTLANRMLKLLDDDPRIVTFLLAQASSADVEIRMRVLGLEALAASRVAQGLGRAVTSGWIDAPPESIPLISHILAALSIPFIIEMLSGAQQSGHREVVTATIGQVVRHGMLTSFGPEEAAAMKACLDRSDETELAISSLLSHGGDRRSVLMDAAAELYAERGYRAVAPADIARRAGLGYGTFYNYFANRRECLSHVTDRELSRIGSLPELLRPIPTTSAEFVTMITRFTMRVTTYFAARGTVLLPVVLDGIGVDDQGQRTIITAFTRTSEIAGDQLRRTGDIIRPTTDFDALGSVVIATVYGVAIHYAQSAPTVPPLDHTVATVVRFLCSGAANRQPR